MSTKYRFDDAAWREIEELPMEHPKPYISRVKLECFDCAKTLAEYDDYYPLTQMVTMYQHWEEVEHPRLRIQKSRESECWLLYSGDSLLRTLWTWEQAMFVAFERHPMTAKRRREKKDWI